MNGKQNKVLQFFKKLGPGLVTGASDDDPSGIATYSQAGAKFGINTLWTALITFPLMAAVQEMCARIGLVTSQGLASNIRNHYPKWVMYVMILFTFPATILNIGADIAGMGAVANLLIPAIPSYYFTVGFTVALMVLIIYLPYQKIAAVLKYLCAFLLLYLIVPFLSKQNWSDIAKHTFIPTIRFDKEFISILVAILGTTISPYLFFWQATMVAEDVNHKKRRLVVNKKVITDLDIDVDMGMFFSNVVMFFIILATGTVLYNGGIRQIDTVEQAAKALEPLAGQFSYLLFAFGVMGTGFLAIPVLSGSLSYILSETFKWNGGLDKKFYQAKPFYLVVIFSLLIGLAINYIGISPIKALIYTAILYGVTSPVLIAVILHIGNNKKVMGEFANRKWSNILGFAALILMTISAIMLLYYQFKG
ncbi:NRAMP family divalent metal transporter [Flavisolibacter tropicus]|uniref:Iron transporter n=1 Tax=Flavisolibacter tropicus TaxID=1492898 RepID=A0A172TYY8_9BACT|nr:divalent metal cation transporter [Flavisolibacter tropicus]ANE52192.1 iron transporter [Flavisolibacter tropicus]